MTVAAGADVPESVSLKFKGGAKMDRTLKIMNSKLGNARAVNVGFLADATYPETYHTRLEHRPSEKRGTRYVAQAAFWLEFGTKKQAPRPAMRTAIEEGSPRWGETLAYLAKVYNYDAQRMMASMGEGIKGQITDSIANWTTPPNRPFTVQVKGFDKPWDDEGILKTKVSYEVVKR